MDTPDIKFSTPEGSGGKTNFKSLLKNKTFLIITGIVAIIAFILFMRKKQTTTTTPEITEDTGNYGDGSIPISGYPAGVVTPSTDIQETPEPTIDNGFNDDIDDSTINIIDNNNLKQDASNKIYNLKDLYTSTKSEFQKEGGITEDENKILSDIHKQAETIALQAGLGYGGIEGNYPGLLEDTRDVNAITGQSLKDPTQVILSEDIKNTRINAQNQINQLKEAYGKAKTQSEKTYIHQQAEKIGIMAGLGVGGTSGGQRKTVDVKTGEFING